MNRKDINPSDEITRCVVVGITYNIKNSLNGFAHDCMIADGSRPGDYIFRKRVPNRPTRGTDQMLEARGVGS